MSELDNCKPGVSTTTPFLSVTGKLPPLDPKNGNRVSAYLVQSGSVLSETRVNAAGNFQFHVAPQLLDECETSVVLGPKGADAQLLAAHTELPRVALSAANKTERGIHIEFSDRVINNELIRLWWFWCREYTVSGTLATAAGCTVGGQVTVYNVTSSTTGLVKTAIETVSTDADGNFSFSFNWCSERCWWPCWPIWWRCWPWWWELDILAVLENIERRVTVQTQEFAPIAPSPAAPLRQPDGADLMTGVAFAGVRPTAALQPDPARTALITAKFNDPRIREIFPYWWWCCENPNLVFSATQGANVILDEDPNISTRWCFTSGQSVALTANNLALGACPVQTGHEKCAFAWSSVGDMPGGVLVGDITSGYANGSGAACSNLAFAGTLNLNGNFSGNCAAFYQVLAAKWSGDPARGATAPLTSQALSLPGQLVNYVSIWREASLSVEVDPVVVGPFSYNGYDNLYTTLSERQTGVLPASVAAQIGSFPTVTAPDFIIGWAAPDLVLTAAAGDLIAPAADGGVTLSILPFDSTGNPLPLAPAPPDFEIGPDLTIVVDTTPFSAALIDKVVVYNSDGTLATQTAASSTSCPAYEITTPGGGYVLVHTKVTDPNGHLCEYYIQTQYGDGSYATANPSDRDYAQAVSSFTAPSAAQAYGVDSGYGAPNAASTPTLAAFTFIGGGDTTQVMITQSCCYDFQLWVSKRTTDGQTFSCSNFNPSFQTVNITVAPVA